MNYSFQLPDIEAIRGQRVLKLYTFNRQIDADTIEPFALNEFNAIVIDFRREPTEHSELFLSLELGKGLSITGEHNNQLLIDINKNMSERIPVVKKTRPASEIIHGQQPAMVYEGMAWFDLKFLIGNEVVGSVQSRIKIYSNVTKIPK